MDTYCRSNFDQLFSTLEKADGVGFSRTAVWRDGPDFRARMALHLLLRFTSRSPGKYVITPPIIVLATIVE
ncbi:hypothetical protein KCP70_16725 [Salmonella enterica subsp. enterica]|nr:hypothetical protein KCP70_16725 [Salmonella enterica subsp. enterica]